METSSKQSSDFKFKIAAFYGFFEVKPNTAYFFEDKISQIAEENKIKGTLLIASEGINGTLCGNSTGITSLLNCFKNGFPDVTMEIKYSWTNKQAFRRFKIRHKKEIVTMGVPDINPLKTVGTYVDSSEWNDLINDEETLVIDTRNIYEVAIGTFDGAFNPETKSFREFPSWVENNLQSIVDKKNAKRIAMFCTGGIRCEKATSYLKKRGFEDIYHLKGGILRYLEEIPAIESKWRGECFVFDQRVSLDHDLNPGEHKLCFACGHPLSLTEQSSDHYIPGVQCNHCIDQYNESDRLRFAERQKQFDQRKNINSQDV